MAIVMKPLPPAQPTLEDIVMWTLVVGRFAIRNGGHYTNFWRDWRLADRRDADLMFWAQRQRSYTFPVDLAPLVMLGLSGWIDCGGALAEWKTLNISYFA